MPNTNKPIDQKDLNEIENNININDMEANVISSNTYTDKYGNEIQETVTIELDKKFVNEVFDRINHMCHEDIIFIEAMKIIAKNQWYFVPLHKRNAEIKNRKIISDVLTAYRGDNDGDDRELISIMLSEFTKTNWAITKFNTIASIFE